MGFRDGWVNLVHRAATGTKTTRTLLTPVGVTVFGVFVALFVFAAITVDRLLDLPGLLPEPVRLPIAVPLIAVGAALAAWSAFHFLKAKGTPVPFNPPPTLVTTGPYRYARNPMLTGVFIFLVGLGLGLESSSLVLVFTPLFVSFNAWELKSIEEPELVRRLGDEYVAYRAQTPMFLPRLKPRSKPRD
jgi:protein-S-isoprenylcysteine O-methyltransferase Ste14